MNNSQYSSLLKSQQDFLKFVPPSHFQNPQQSFPGQSAPPPPYDPFSLYWFSKYIELKEKYDNLLKSVQQGDGSVYLGGDISTSAVDDPEKAFNPF
ncbi:hypothetical protein QTN25_005714 [Entamoeba marina]